VSHFESGSTHIQYSRIPIISYIQATSKDTFSSYHALPYAALSLLPTHPNSCQTLELYKLFTYLLTYCTTLKIPNQWELVSEQLGFNLSINLLQVILETSLSKQPLALVLTTEQEQPQHKKWKSTK